MVTSRRFLNSGDAHNGNISIQLKQSIKTNTKNTNNTETYLRLTKGPLSNTLGN